jgi:fluoroacetyl-CoA thioesterase
MAGPLQEGSMRPVPIGAQGSYSLLVAPEHLASQFKDPMLPPVLSTPVMIMAMENAALAALKPYLEKGETAVGSRVDVRHLAATPVGRRITARAEVTGVEGRRITFAVRADDGDEEIGVGTHERALIELDKFAAHLAQKVRGQSKP